MKKGLSIILVVAVFIAGILISKWYFQKQEEVVTEDSTVLIEQIKSVSKLITVEGYLAEIYDYKDYYGYDIPGFRKKALIRVKAKVSVGYDLERMKITTNADEKVIRLSEIPMPELLSIDHELDYYDIQEGIFNAFSTEDYNKLNSNAKEFVRQKAQESELFDKAKLQKNNVFEMINLLVETAGWQLEIEESGLKLLPDK